MNVILISLFQVGIGEHKREARLALDVNMVLVLVTEDNRAGMGLNVIIIACSSINIDTGSKKGIGTKFKGLQSSPQILMTLYDIIKILFTQAHNQLTLFVSQHIRNRKYYI